MVRDRPTLITSLILDDISSPYLLSELEAPGWLPRSSPA